MTAPRLEMTDLTRRYDGRAVVADLSLTVMPGQVTCLLGPSGCGKSTTLRMVAGVERPDAGRIAVDGQVICDPHVDVPPEARGIGLMFQDFALFPHLTVAQNVGFGLSGVKSARRARVAALLARVDLERFSTSYPHELSGGEQQRVALARALAPKPRIMLMDEPFSGLDNRLRDDIRDETLAILRQEDTAVLLVTHEPEEAMRMADEIALMRAGRIVQRGTPFELYTAPVDRAALRFFSDANALDGIARDGAVETPFGVFFAPDLRDGPVEVVFRLQHLRIDFDRAGIGPRPTASDGVAVSARVVRSRFLGAESLVTFAVETTGQHLKARVPNVFLPAQGTLMWLTVPRRRAMVFAKD